MFEAAVGRENPKLFETLPLAMSYVTRSSASHDLTRPWIRDFNRPTISGSFIMISGRMMAVSPRSRPTSD
jgi:hypothetical protein